MNYQPAALRLQFRTARTTTMTRHWNKSALLSRPSKTSQTKRLQLSHPDVIGTDADHRSERDSELGPHDRSSGSSGPDGVHGTGHRGSGADRDRQLGGVDHSHLVGADFRPF
ncbi:hypothetical protein DPMN_078324 [Dreissena polymorpha]|uniref:Uncharacterized protein n=1 Tax=Dreissena polymorpha TaxID=45954 RepID=A0A9D4BS23_DREPO|nr:hypothetical protein DPMN_078324 [Dreissena polymorpha]